MYEKLCNDILEVIKDKNNIKDVFHCVTRLRIIFKDKSEINLKDFEKIDGIIQVKEVGNQIQLVIGSNVGDVYKEFCSIIGFEEKAEVPEDNLETNKEVKPKKRGKGKYLNMLLETISRIMLPIIPAIIAGGMLKGVVSTIEAFNWLPAGSSVLTVLTIIGDAPFYFLPFLVGYTSAKRFKVDSAFGIMIAGVLMYPTIINQAAGETIRYFFLNIPSYSYSSSVFPVILSVYAFSLVFRFVDKYINKNLRIVFSALIAFIIIMPINLAFVAPLGNYIGVLLSSGIQFLFGLSAPIAGAIFTAILPLVIMFGAHQGFFPVMLNNLTSLGYSFLLPLFFLSNIAMGGATLGASFKINNSKDKSSAVYSGALCIIGITEPALYGIGIKYKKPLYAAFIGGAIGGFVAMLLSVKTYSFTLPGIFSLTTYFDSNNNFLLIIISVIITFVSSSMASYIMTKTSKEIK